MIVKVFANLRDICGGDKIEVQPDGDRVIDVLNKMTETYQGLDEEVFTEERTLKPFVHVFINGKNIIHANGLETTVKESDQFALFPPVAGG